MHLEHSCCVGLGNRSNDRTAHFLGNLGGRI
jgi:hypothetical protein